MTPEEAVDAMREGADARRDGKPFSSCPHGDGTSEGNEWRYGYRAEKRMERLYRNAVPPIVAQLKKAVGYRG